MSLKNIAAVLFITGIFTGYIAAQGSLTNDLVSYRSERSSSVSPEKASSDNAAASTVSSIEQTVFVLINKERVKAGLNELKWSDKIALVARYHSGNMADLNFFSHRGLDGLMVDDRAEKLGVGRWRAVGENIAFMQGFADPAAKAVEKWLLSSSHRNNLLNPQWTESAIGLAITADGKYYFTQVFLVEPASSATLID